MTVATPLPGPGAVQAPPTPTLAWRTGFEVEVLAPRGSSRGTLARELAARAGGTVTRSWHLGTEPSLVPGMGHFRQLTAAFQVADAHGRPLCRLVDDVTLQDDLDRAAPPRPGWYRLLSDDARLLRLVEALADPAAGLDDVLAPLAAAFGVPVRRTGTAVRVDDASGATVVLGAPLPGERERPCEVVTPPLVEDHLGALERLLGCARELGFTVPREAAVHLHLDAAPFRSVAALGNVVRLFGRRREALHAALGTNHHCRMLGPLPPALVDLVDGQPAVPGGWEAFRAAAAATGAGRFLDVNLTSVLAAVPPSSTDTLEVRLLPGSLDAAAVVRRSALVEGLLRRCLDPDPLPPPGRLDLAESVAELHALAAGEL